MERKHKNPRTSIEANSLEKLHKPHVKINNNHKIRLYNSLTSIQKRIHYQKEEKKKSCLSQKCFKQQHKDEIYYQLVNFLNSIIKNPLRLIELFEKLQFTQKKEEKQLSLKDSSNIDSAQVFSRSFQFSNQQIKHRNRISIKSLESLFSSESLLSLTSFDCLDISFQSDYELSLEIVKIVYDSPSPFLIIESLCLLCKFLWKSIIKLSKQNCVKLLAASTILAYKILYDQQITGIHSHFGSFMNFEAKQLNGIQAKFLKQIQFELQISNLQYYIISQELLIKKC